MFLLRTHSLADNTNHCVWTWKNQLVPALCPGSCLLFGTVATGANILGDLSENGILLWQRYCVGTRLRNSSSDLAFQSKLTHLHTLYHLFKLQRNTTNGKLFLFLDIQLIICLENTEITILSKFALMRNFWKTYLFSMERTWKNDETWKTKFAARKMGLFAVERILQNFINFVKFCLFWNPKKKL